MPENEIPEGWFDFSFTQIHEGDAKVAPEALAATYMGLAIAVAHEMKKMYDTQPSVEEFESLPERVQEHLLHARKALELHIRILEVILARIEQRDAAPFGRRDDEEELGGFLYAAEL